MVDPINNKSANDKRLLKHRRSSALNYDDVQIIEMFENEGCKVIDITREIVTSGTRRRVYKVINYVASCGHTCSIRFNKFLLGQGRQCHSCSMPRRERHHAFNPNLTDEERLCNRDVIENVKWRESVYKRDNYKCSVCGDNHGGNLIAHHLNSYADFPDERFTLDNGITLCESCHKRFHKRYTYHHNTKDQFKEWIEQDNTEVILGVTA